MKRFLTPTLIALTCVLVLSVGQAFSLRIAPSPIPLRVAAADLVITGKTTGFTAKLEPSELFKGDTRQMQIANVQVSEELLGKPGKTIKVGFFPPQAAGNVGGRPIRPINRGGVTLTVGQEALLFLTKHPTKKDVYVVQMYFDVVNKKDNPNFATELAEAKRYAKMLANPMDGLKSKNAQERFETAAMMLTRYRTAKAGMTKTEPIPAEESKLILTALAEADWNTRNPRNFMLNPQQMFYRLGLTAKDGWTQPKDFRQTPVEAKKWLQANAGKYRIQRYVRSEKPATEPGTEPNR